MPKTPPIAARMARIVTPVGRSTVAGVAEIGAAAGGGGLAAGGVGSDAMSVRRVVESSAPAQMAAACRRTEDALGPA